MEKTAYNGQTLFFGFNDKIKDALGSNWVLDTSDGPRTEYECLIKTESPEYIMDFCSYSMRKKIKADPERAWAEWKQCPNAARHAAAKRMYEVRQITINISTTLREKVTDEDIRRFNGLLGKLGCEITAGPNEKSPDFFLRSDCREIGHGVRGTLEEAKAEADDFFFSGKDGMIYTYDGEPVAIKRWLGRERRFADWADVAPDDHIPHFGPITNASYGIGIPQIFMCPGLKGNEPELANLQEVYVAACDYGDFKMGFYTDADEAAEAAEDAWNSLALSEKRRQHIFSGVIRREDLNFNHMDDDILAEGRVDWWCYTKKIGTYPGAFDSEKEENRL